MCLFVQMGAEIKVVDVTGRFDTVTGQRSLFLILYHKEKAGSHLCGQLPDKLELSYFL